MTTEEQSLPDCGATAVLTEAEIQGFSEMPDGEHVVDAGQGKCEFSAHGPEVLHASLVQTQFDGASETPWWLRWNEDGYREIRVEPFCRKPDEDDLCLLVVDHPGECEISSEDGDGDEWNLVYCPDGEDGWSWELRQGNRLLHFTDELSREQGKEAQEWAAVMLLEFEEITVSGWMPNEGVPDCWTAGIAHGSAVRSCRS